MSVTFEISACANKAISNSKLNKFSVVYGLLWHNVVGLVSYRTEEHEVLLNEISSLPINKEVLNWLSHHFINKHITNILKQINKGGISTNALSKNMEISK